MYFYRCRDREWRREKEIYIYPHTCIYITPHSVFVVAPVLNPHGMVLLSSVNVVANVGFLGILVYKKLFFCCDFVMICNAICNYFIEHR